jgi:hypothetical protein
LVIDKDITQWADESDHFQLSDKDAEKLASYIDKFEKGVEVVVTRPLGKVSRLLNSSLKPYSRNH